MWSAGPRHSCIVYHMAAYWRRPALDGAGGLCAECLRKLRTAVIELPCGVYLYRFTGHCYSSDIYFPWLNNRNIKGRPLASRRYVWFVQKKPTATVRMIVQ